MLHKIDEDESASLAELIQLIQSKPHPPSKYDWLAAELSLIKHEDQTIINAMITYHSLAKEQSIPPFYTYFALATLLRQPNPPLEEQIKQLRLKALPYHQIAHLISLRELLLSKTLSNQDETSQEQQIEDLRFITIELTKRVSQWKTQLCSPLGNSSPAITPFFLDKHGHIYLLKILTDNEQIIEKHPLKYISMPNPFFQTHTAPQKLFEHKLQQDIQLCLQILAEEKANELKNTVHMGSLYRAGKDSSKQKELRELRRKIEAERGQGNSNLSNASQLSVLGREEAMRSKHTASMNELDQLIRRKELAVLKDLMKKTVETPQTSPLKNSKNSKASLVKPTLFLDKIKCLKAEVSRNETHRPPHTIDQKSILKSNLPPKMHIVQERETIVKHSLIKTPNYKSLPHTSIPKLKAAPAAARISRKKSMSVSHAETERSRVSGKHDQIDDSLREVSSRLREETIRSIYSKKASVGPISKGLDIDKLKDEIRESIREKRIRAAQSKPIALQSRLAGPPDVVPLRKKSEEVKKRLEEEERRFVKLKEEEYRMREQEMSAKYQKELTLLAEEQAKKNKEMEARVRDQEIKARQAQQQLRSHMRESQDIKRKLEEKQLRDRLYQEILQEEQRKDSQKGQEQLMQVKLMQEEYRRASQKRAQEQAKKEKEQIQAIYEQLRLTNQEIQAKNKLKLIQIKEQQQKREMQMQKEREKQREKEREREKQKQREREKQLQLVVESKQIDSAAGNDMAEVVRERVKEEVLQEMQIRRRKEEEEERQYCLQQKERIRKLEQEIGAAMKAEEEEIRKMEADYQRQHQQLAHKYFKGREVQAEVDRQIAQELLSPNHQLKDGNKEEHKEEPEEESIPANPEIESAQEGRKEEQEPTEEKPISNESKQMQGKQIVTATGNMKAEGDPNPHPGVRPHKFDSGEMELKYGNLLRLLKESPKPTKFQPISESYLTKFFESCPPLEREMLPYSLSDLQKVLESGKVDIFDEGTLGWPAEDKYVLVGTNMHAIPLIAGKYGPVQIEQTYLLEKTNLPQKQWHAKMIKKYEATCFVFQKKNAAKFSIKYIWKVC